MVPRELIFLPFTWTAKNISYRLRVEGKKHIPQKGGALLICNHVSYVDAIAIMAASPRPVRFVMAYPPGGSSDILARPV